MESERLATRQRLSDRTLSVRLGTAIAILAGIVAGFAVGVSKLGGAGPIFQAFSSDPLTGTKHCINGYVYQFVQRDDLPNAILELIADDPPEDEERLPDAVYKAEPVRCESAVVERRSGN
nr:hypothetical protein [Pseudomonas aeruginosa]